MDTVEPAGGATANIDDEDDTAPRDTQLGGSDELYLATNKDGSRYTPNTITHTCVHHLNMGRERVHLWRINYYALFIIIKELECLMSIF